MARPEVDVSKVIDTIRGAVEEQTATAIARVDIGMAFRSISAQERTGLEHLSTEQLLEHADQLIREERSSESQA